MYFISISILTPVFIVTRSFTDHSSLLIYYQCWKCWLWDNKVKNDQYFSQPLTNPLSNSSLCRPYAHKSRPTWPYACVCVRERSWFIMLCKHYFSVVSVAPDNSRITANRGRQQKDAHQDSRDVPGLKPCTKRREFMFLMPAEFTDVNILRLEG